MGAGLAALIALVTSDLGSGAPKVLGAVAASLIIVGGGALAVARIKFEWAGTKLERAVDDGTSAGDPLPADEQAWPKVGEVAWLTGLVCVPLAALVYAAAVWWTVA